MGSMGVPYGNMVLYGFNVGMLAEFPYGLYMVPNWNIVIWLICPTGLHATSFLGKLLSSFLSSFY